MHKMTIDDVDFKGKRVLLRVDYNVPMEQGEITDDTRIRATLPTIKKLLNDGASLVIISHLGRPSGKVMKELSLRPVAKRLAELLEKNVEFLQNCVGKDITKRTKSLKPGEIVMLENLRFHPGEKANDENFSAQLAKHGDIYVNDAFAVCHRAHASVVGIPKILSPACAGYLIEKEIKYLGILLEDPPQPFIAIIGGAKVSTKIGVLENLLPRVDKLLIGGGMSFTFFSSLGLEIGKSLVEKEALTTAMKIWVKSEEKGGKMMLPVDVLVAESLDEDSPVKTVEYDRIPKNLMGVDIGQSTIQLYQGTILEAKTVFLNGPMGVFEVEKFSEGTKTILESMAELAQGGDIAVVGGGDSAAAVHKFNLADEMTHVSTGGGASLEFMEGKELPGIAALSDA
ncbi:phosphoglycerate kinase [bacterium]|nr:MAG: phosphoglycerate kinase [bacterium]